MKFSYILVGVFALLQGLAVQTTLAQDGCSLVIEGSDRMQFNTMAMEAPSSCAEITVTLVHTGNLPKEAMGHNWVLTTDSDFMPVAQAGMGAGLDNNYLPPGDDRVIAATNIIGGGESTSVTFSTSGLAAGQSYTYFCSFVGHWAVMKGSFKLV